MKVILQKNVPNLGDAGEIKEVANGYATNYLIPKKLVIPATAGSRKQLAHQGRLIKLKTDRRMGEMKQVFEKVNGLSLEIMAKVGRKGKLFGSVGSIDISKALKEQGFDIEKRKIEMQPFREIGKRPVTIKLADDLKAEITVEVKGDEASLAELAKLEAEEEARQAERALAEGAGEEGAEGETSAEGEAGSEASAEAESSEEPVAEEAPEAEAAEETPEA